VPLQHQNYPYTRRGYSPLITHSLTLVILPEKRLSGHKQGVCMDRSTSSGLRTLKLVTSQYVLQLLPYPVSRIPSFLTLLKSVCALLSLVGSAPSSEPSFSEFRIYWESHGSPSPSDVLKFLFSRLPGAGSPRQGQELHCVQDLPSIGVTNYDAITHSHLVLWACLQRFVLFLVLGHLYLFYSSALC